MAQKITAIERQKKNPKRVSVYLNDQFAFGLSEIIAGWLHVGQELSEAEIADLQRKDSEEVAYQKTLNFLSYRVRSVKEIRDYLKKHKTPPEITATIIERLIDLKLLDDHTFAKTWVENREAFRPRSKRVLRIELRQKGINEEIIRQVLEPVNDQKSAIRLASKQSRKYAGLEWFEFRKKLSAFLARKGFDYGTISPIVSQTWNEMTIKTNTDE